jgi:hypothetical protein
MAKDLSRFCTKEYIEKLQRARPGTKVIMHKPTYTKNLTIGGRSHGEPCGMVRATGQRTWVGIEEHDDGYIVGVTYVFEIVGEDRIAYVPWNKPGDPQ